MDKITSTMLATWLVGVLSGCWGDTTVNGDVNFKIDANWSTFNTKDSLNWNIVDGNETIGTTDKIVCKVWEILVYIPDNKTCEEYWWVNADISDIVIIPEENNETSETNTTTPPENNETVEVEIEKFEINIHTVGIWILVSGEIMFGWLGLDPDKTFITDYDSSTIVIADKWVWNEEDYKGEIPEKAISKLNISATGEGEDTITLVENGWTDKERIIKVTFK